uniref:N-acetyltransferase domain-containing protein n=1 Tax=Pyricularia oryzae (strain P131) TaxID=1143193 RepID=L7JB90_PYRO1
MPINYSPATAADVTAIARVGSAAFDPATDPMMRRIFPQHLQQPGVDAQAKWRAWRKTCRLQDDPNSIIMVAVDEELDEVVGYAWWVAPPKPDQEPFVAPKEPKFAGVDPEARGRRLSPSSLRLSLFLARAVNTTHGRKGIGKNLVQWGLDRARSDKKDAYLIATPMGKPLYERLGFVAIGDVPFLGINFTSMIVKNNPHTRLEDGRVVHLNEAEAAA